MQNELDIVRDVSQRLDAVGIGSMLTGSMAMNYYAQPRMTRDIDVVVALRREDAGRVVKLFSPDYYVSRGAVDSSIAYQWDRQRPLLISGPTGALLAGLGMNHCGTASGHFDKNQRLENVKHKKLPPRLFR